ncbi:MAG: hypothetical protein KF745_06880 [Phycisphaeraceae bacterium]|nr:hypothetical protein [Phycisphaeraceae bacterium]
MVNSVRALSMALAGVVAVLLAGAPLHGQVPQSVVRYDGYRVVRVNVGSIRDLQTMEAIGGEVWRCGGVVVGVSDYLVSPEAQEGLKAAGLKSTVVIDDVQRLIDAERDQIAAVREQEAAGLRGPGYFSTYRTYDEISAFVDTLVAAHPELCSRFTVGQSLQARTVFGIKITSIVGGAGVKPQIVLYSLQHAREWITGATTMWIADRLVNSYASDASVRRLVDGYEILIVPIVNPDGFVYTWTNNRMWRKNRRDNGNGTIGVDPNRNWGYQWGGEGAATNPAEETYRGPGPFSEPETQNMRDFLLANPRTVFAVDIHSYGQLILSPWSYTSELPSDSGVFETLNAGMKNAFESTGGLAYRAGPTYSTIYPASGASGDWGYAVAGALAYGFELRDTGQNGFTLPADQIVPSATECYNAIAWAAGWLLDHRLYLGFPTGTPVMVEAGTTTPITFEARRGMKQPAPGSARLYSRIGRSAAFTSNTLTDGGDGTFTAMVQAGPCNSVVQVYLEAQTVDGETVWYPAAGPNGAIELAAMQSVAAFSDGFETNLGWTVGSPQDNATSGQWVRGDPIGTAAQPEDAHAGSQCFFTGQGTVGGAAGQADVDGGQTTLTSPTFSLAGSADGLISYWRWYSNNQGAAPAADTFLIDVSSDNGATWRRAETVGPAGAEAVGGWRSASWRLSLLSPAMTPTATMKVRFIAQDQGAGSIVEAAVDNFAAVRVGCPTPACAGDFDRDGVVQPVDLAQFVNAWAQDLGAGTLVADFNGDGEVTPTDIAVFVNAWFSSIGACG